MASDDLNRHAEFSIPFEEEEEPAGLQALREVAAELTGRTDGGVTGVEDKNDVNLSFVLDKMHLILYDVQGGEGNESQLAEKGYHGSASGYPGKQDMQAAVFI